MMGRSHIIIGVGICGALMAGGCIAPGRWEIIGAVAGSLAPDIDTPYSIIGRFLPFLAHPIHRIAGHRTASHSAIGVMVAIAVSAGMETWQAYLGLAFLTGYMAHIGADLMTKEGCAMLYPLNRKRYKVWPSVKTGGKGESLVVLIIAALLGLLIYFLHPDVFNPATWGAALLNHLTFAHLR